MMKIDKENFKVVSCKVEDNHLILKVKDIRDNKEYTLVDHEMLKYPRYK